MLCQRLFERVALRILSTIRLTLVLSAFVGLAALTEAETVTWDFEGTVEELADSGGNLGGVTTGQTYTAYLTFDTALPDHHALDNIGEYWGALQEFSVTFEDGQWFAFDADTTAIQDYLHEVNIYDNPTYDFWNAFAQEDIQSNVAFDSSLLPRLTLQFSDSSGSAITTGDEHILDPNPLSQWNDAVLFVEFFDSSGNPTSWVRADVSTLTSSAAAPAAVPLPPAGGLGLLGLGMLGLVRRRRSRA